jgi:hypothetical protein
MLVVFTAGHTRSHDAVIRVYDESGNVISDARAQGRFQRLVKFWRSASALQGVGWQRDRNAQANGRFQKGAPAGLRHCHLAVEKAGLSPSEAAAYKSKHDT